MVTERVLQAVWIVQTAVESGAEATAHAAESESPTIPELPNFIHVLHAYFPGNALINWLLYFENQVFMVLIIAALAFFFSMATRNRTLVPSRMQAFVELVLERLYLLVCGILGEKEGRRYFPFVGSLFFFIFFMNWAGLVPLMKSPTSNLKVTGALAVTVFFYVQYTALTRQGPKKYLFHMMGEPRDAVGYGVAVLLLPLHIMEEFIKPLSLACRLYGNIFGEDLLLGIGLMLGIQMIMAVIPLTPIGIPLHLPFVLLSMLMGTIQALVFTLLATVYIVLVLPHGEHDGHEETGGKAH
ncbi:MAG TPA: F0F1 ATP synthase subunit A [bacterium]|nr:F0F1 ATP synthase subunit A [Candidatus Omnitrophota bacterium]HOJ61054.1 F0F1 ATP synthase subunit A [bacterium]